MKPIKANQQEKCLSFIKKKHKEIIEVVKRKIISKLLVQKLAKLYHICSANTCLLSLRKYGDFSRGHNI
jgi:hypothetical protein